jgi:hypothetical protein
VEILSWGKRTIVNDNIIGTHAFLHASFRLKGSGGRKSGHFTIGPFLTVETATISD